MKQLRWTAQRMNVDDIRCAARRLCDLELCAHIMLGNPITTSNENATDDLLTSDAHLHTVGAQEEKFCSIPPCLDPADA